MASLPHAGAPGELIRRNKAGTSAAVTWSSQLASPRRAGIAVAVGVGVAVGVADGWGVVVGNSVGRGVGVGVAGMRLAVAVGLLGPVTVGEGARVALGVGVGLGNAVSVELGVEVGVGVCGNGTSRLASLLKGDSTPYTSMAEAT